MQTIHSAFRSTACSAGGTANFGVYTWLTLAQEDTLPAERTIRDILNRMNYRLKRIQKGKPLKKTEHTDAIFENVHAAGEKYKDDPEALEISVDTKAKVSLHKYKVSGTCQVRVRYLFGNSSYRLSPARSQPDI